MEHPRPWPPEPTPSRENLRRCRSCYYVIDHLGEYGVCPECGLSFNLHDPTSYTTKPPFLWWSFWLPGFLTALVSGVILYLVMVPNFGYGWATVFAVPMAAGVILGYRVRGCGLAALALLGTLLIVGLMAALGGTGMAGIFCIMVLGGLAVAPVTVGATIGWVLQKCLKWSKFRQRSYLPVIFFATLLTAFIEGRHEHLTTVTTSTSVDMDATPTQAWAAIQFYEQVKHKPPLLLRITPTFRPQYTTGQSGQVGDVKVCVYERGRLSKQVTEVIPGKRLAFRVIEQTDIQNRGVRLIDGSFDFEPLEGGRTRVTLTTRYQPQLEPRFAFLPAENLAVHTLHGHVLKGMSEDAESR